MASAPQVSVASRAIQFLRKELEVTMALCGVNNVREIGRHMIA